MAKKSVRKKDIPQMPKAIHSPNRHRRYERRLVEVLSREPKQTEIQRLFLGRAGETFVAAHLLRRGLNCSPLPVDTGIDLLAHKEVQHGTLLLQAEHELYQFQVKTTATSEYRASLSVRKIHDLWHKAINLVVVFWSDEANPISIVLPPSLIRMLTSGGFESPKSPLVATGDEVSLRVIKSGERFFLRNRDNDISGMVNRFDLIEPLGVDTFELPAYASWSDGAGLIDIDFSFLSKSE